MRISAPPVKWPCFYGIDFATRAELIATGLGVEEIRASIGADSLGYLSEDDMIAATEQPARPALPGLLRRRATRSRCPTRRCSASTCSSGRCRSPTSPGTGTAHGHRDVEGVPVGLSGGAADALNRP